ncbi:orexin/Hypocretin receptor type 1-like isoform X1 [Branchiostoma lanceolatum]|uniref:orexin/Hypocretin receptor type 1-like isoform X1 n=1 Tax=Branchiostoma lanceolatum TaxID=7740 RepID=UPI0034549EB4
MSNNSTAAATDGVFNMTEDAYPTWVLPTPPDYDLEGYLLDYLFPKHYEWALIIAYILVFLLALIGNGLVCFVVIRNSHMRTVTNYFIANLSAGDLLVTIICLPPTLVVDIMETWFFGETMCKIIPYLQMVSVSVSVLTLCAIAVERWYAIVHPLKFKSTNARARTIICLIWVVSLSIMAPLIPMYKTSRTLPAEITDLMTVCDEHWPDPIYGKIYHAAIVMVLFGIPIVLMMVSYCMIVWKLWSDQVPVMLAMRVAGGEVVRYRKRKGGISSSTSLRAPTHSDDSRIKTPVSRSTSDTIIRSASSSAAAVVTASSSFHSGTGSIADRTAENTVQSRRKVARMLVAVVVVFAVCYIPLMILTFLKRVYGFFDNTHDREGLYAAFTVSHWLLYLNSAINPLIYNFMSERFRSEFKASLPCCFPEAARKKREARGMTVGRPTISRMHTTRTTGTTELLSRFESTTRYPSTYEFAFARDRNEFGLSRFDSRPLPKSPIIPHDAMKPRELPKAPYDTIQQETDLRMISEHASEQASEAAEISCVVPTLCTNDLPKEID